MPLYHLTTRGAAVFTNDLLTAGRWVAFISAVLTGITIGLLAWFAIPSLFAASVRAATAIMCGLLCFNLSTISWAQFMRIDMLAIFLTFAGLLAFARSPGRRGLDYAAFLLFVLAWFTKQTYIAAPAACLLAAFLCRRAQGVRLFAFSVLLGGAGLTALAIPTHGDALVNLFLYNDNPFSVLNMLGIVQLNLATMVPLAAIAFAVPVAITARVAWRAPLFRRAAVRRWLEHSPTRRIMALCSLHLLFAFAVSFTAGKKGSNYNYFLEWNLACCVLVGLVTLFALRGLSTKAISAPQLAILLVLLLFATNGPAALAERLRPAPPSTHGQDSERAMAFLRSLPGPVYSENMTILLRTGKEVPAEPDVITALAQRGRWDEQPFVDQLASGFFSAIIVTTSLDNRNRFSPAVQAAIEKAYTLRYNYGEFHIFLPKLTWPGISRTG